MDCLSQDYFHPRGLAWVEKVVETRPESVWMSGSETGYSTYMALAVSSVIVCILRLCFSAGILAHLKNCNLPGTEPRNMYESDGDSEAERDGLGPYNVLLDSSF